MEVYDISPKKTLTDKIQALKRLTTDTMQSFERLTKKKEKHDR